MFQQVAKQPFSVQSQPVPRKAIVLGILGAIVFISLVIHGPTSAYGPLSFVQSSASISSASRGSNAASSKPLSASSIPVAQMNFHLQKPINGEQDALARIRQFRINQMDTSQYASVSDANTWANSACSATAMTVLLNSYSSAGKYHIKDVLQVEAASGAITPEDGTTSEQSVVTTLEKFGFAAVKLNDPSLDDVIRFANKGYPEIVNLPPALWYNAGHYMVVFGGDDQNVYTADSSTSNLTVWSRANFLAHWAGPGYNYAVVAVPAAFSIFRAPTVSAAVINQVLAASPAHGMGQLFVDLGRKYGVDPAAAVAFYFHESKFGTRGVATATKSLGNIRCTPGASCVLADGSTCSTYCPNGYRSYASIADALNDWYQLLSGPYYRGSGLLTLPLIIDKYAPTVDNNDEIAYVSSVTSSMLNLQEAGHL
jgi:hypothetical protein